MLILDSHVTHTQNLAATEMAREAGVFMVSVPSHTTHRLQSLDVAISGSFGKYYDDAPYATSAPAVAAPALTSVAMVTAQEHNPTPPLTPVVAAPALTAVAMDAVPELSPPKKETS